MSAAIGGNAHGNELALSGARGRTLARHRRARTGTLLALDDPASQQVGIQAVGKGNAGDRDAGLTALRDHARLEFVAVTSSATTSGYRLGQSVHVSTKK